APDGRGIGGLGSGAQGRPKHLFRTAEFVGVWAVRGRRVEGRGPRVENGTRNTQHAGPLTFLLPRPPPLRPQPHVQADARHAALPYDAAGLLAVAASGGWRVASGGAEDRGPTFVVRYSRFNVHPSSPRKGPLL